MERFMAEVPCLKKKVTPSESNITGYAQRNFMSSWLREDKEGKRKREKEVDKEVRKDVGERERERERKKEDEAVV